MSLNPSILRRRSASRAADHLRSDALDLPRRSTELLQLLLASDRACLRQPVWLAAAPSIDPRPPFEQRVSDAASNGSIGAPAEIALLQRGEFVQLVGGSAPSSASQPTRTCIASTLLPFDAELRMQEQRRRKLGAEADSKQARKFSAGFSFSSTRHHQKKLPPSSTSACSAPTQTRKHGRREQSRGFAHRRSSRR